MKKRVFAALMCLCLLLTLLPTTAVAAGGGAIQLGASGIAKGNTVYYGNYAQSDATGATKDPIKWRVLSTTPNGTKTTDEAWSAGDGLLLLSGQNLDVQPYHVENENVTWRRSTLRSWLNGYAAEENKGGDDGVDYTSNNFINTAFDEKESAQILQTKLENAKNPTYDTAGGVATTDRVFALSIAEVNSLDYFADNAARFGANTAYVASKEEMSSEGDGDIWWLRSPGDNNNRAAAVDDVCSVIDSGYTVPSSVVAVRPAFNLGLDAVLFTSAAVGGKSASGMDSGLTAVSTTTPTEWKLTLLDADRTFSAATTAVSGDTLTLSYSGAATGANEYISAIVKDNSGDITRYGRLKNTTAAADASGTVNIDLSGVTMAATDTLYVFSEQYNGGVSDDTKLTDYASALVEVSLTITPPAHTHSWLEHWKTNSTHHWHECEGEGCTVTENSGKDKYGAHVYDDDADMFCNVCDYNRKQPIGASGIAKGDKVYFGQYTDSGTTYVVPWIALNDIGFLLSEYTIGVSTFRDTDGYYNYSYANSTEDSSNLKRVMDGLYNGRGTTLFTDLEQGAVEETPLSGNSMYDSNTPAVDAYLFPLSLSEARNISFDGNKLLAQSIDTPERYTGWWLRSSFNRTAPYYVEDTGILNYFYYDNSLGVRPAFNLDLNSVLFTSAAVGGKSVTGMDSGLTAISTTTPTEWKLTLKDDSRSFAVTDTAFTGTNAFITYSGAATGANEYISAMVKDSSGNVTNYGRLKHTTATADASGTVNIDLSGVGDMTGKTLYVFSEQYNGGTNDDSKLTDYASALVNVTVAVTNSLTNITSNGLPFAIVSANYTATLTADSGYSLPASITVKIGGTELTAGTGYIYDSTSGVLTIYAASITGDIEITAAGVLQEQFTLPVGETYWFDLSGAGIPGTPNAGNEYGAVSMPDTTLHYVPFTYAGTVNAYSLGENSSGDVAASGNATPSLRSLFVADYAVTNNVSWDDDLNDKSLIFGKSYASGGVNYTLRAPSAGSACTGSAINGSDHIGTPNTNEWDAVLDKGNGYIKNWDYMSSWGQDTASAISSCRANRGYTSARRYNWSTSSLVYPDFGFRPVLEVLNPATLTSDGLKAVALHLNGGKVGNESGALKIVYTGNSFTAPAKDGLTRPNGNTGSYFKWLGSGGVLYAPGDAVPSAVTALTAQWTAPHTHAWATTVWTTNVTHHWHECSAAGCTITDDSGKDSYGTHTAGDWVIDTNATASTSGSKHKECTVCGYVMETATIPATGGGGSYDPTDYYALTFDTNGGSSISTARVSEYATVDLTLSKYIPTREGYEFTGWYSDKALTVKITGIRLTKNTTIYAGWEDKTNPNTGIDNPFTDVKDTDWFFDDVMFVYGNKLMVGTSATTFSPNDTTTRAMVVTILWRMEGSPKVTGSSGFTDVSDGKYYTDAVTWAKQNDIIKGYSNTLFGPNDPVTREQLAAFFYRYAQYKGYDTTISGSISSFKDKDKVSDWAVDAMKWAVGYGVIQGKTGNLLDPQGDATRAQLAAMLHRLIEKTSLWRA